MNRLLLFILLSLPYAVFSQQEYSKEEIYKEWLELTKNVSLDYRVHFNKKVIEFFDSLKNAGIDTIGIYEEHHIGSLSLDSCDCDNTPWKAAIHWKEKGNTFHISLKEFCNSSIMHIENSTLINYYNNSSESIKTERIMPNILSLEKNEKGNLIFDFLTIDHTNHYLIYCNLNNNSYFTRFNEYDFENSKSIFHFDNNNSIIKSWLDLIQHQLEEIK